MGKSTNPEFEKWWIKNEQKLNLIDSKGSYSITFVAGQLSREMNESNYRSWAEKQIADLKKALANKDALIEQVEAGLWLANNPHGL